MLATTETMIKVPDQSVLEGLMADAQGVADAIAEVLGAECASVSIQVRHVPADTYHALPHETRTSNQSAWKDVAHGKSTSSIYATCGEDKDCPERIALAVGAEFARQGIDPVYEAAMADRP